MTETLPQKKYLKVRLVKSSTGRIPNHRACLETLGLRKIGSFNILPDNEKIRGVIRKVSYLVSLEEIS